MAAGAERLGGLDGSGAGWSFDFSTKKWTEQPVRSNGGDAYVLQAGRSLRCATLNVLCDMGKPHVLHHDIRYEYICKELGSLDADLIGLNEVTPRFLERLLQKDWVRNQYTTSIAPSDPKCENLAVNKHFGNVVLSRIPPVKVEYRTCVGKEREFHVVTLRISSHDRRSPVDVAVTSAHLVSLPWVNEQQRKVQLNSLTDALIKESNLDSCIIMGDFNFHREAENSSIPKDWLEIPAVVDLGMTWEYTHNPMVPKMCGPLNLYNSFGFGIGWIWQPCMRLDRVITYGTALNIQAAVARQFANQLIHQAQPDSIESAATEEDWHCYLFPSDHYGIVFDIPLSTE